MNLLSSTRATNSAAQRTVARQQPLRWPGRQFGDQKYAVALTGNHVAKRSTAPRSTPHSPSRLVAREQFRCRAPSRLLLEMPYLVHLLSSSESMDMNSLASLDFGSNSLQSVHQFEVFGTELVDQRIGLFGERLDRLSIGLLNRFDLTLELG